jgi:DNA-binding LacI/PurR family transcriptional regulator
LAATAERLEQLIPHAVWLDSSTWHEHNCIRRDEVAAGHLAGRSLAQAGYRDWIYLRRPEGAREHYSAAHRQVGVLAAAGDARANLRIAYQDFGQEIDPAFITALTPQTGLILGDPYFIPEVMRASMRARRCPGQDFALVACDEEFASTGYTWEDLSRVSFPRFDMGVRAAQMMISLLDAPGHPRLAGRQPRLPVRFHHPTLPAGSLKPKNHDNFTDSSNVLGPDAVLGTITIQ